MLGRLFSSGGRNKGAVDQGLGRDRDLGLLGKAGITFGNADAQRANFFRSGSLRRVPLRRLPAPIEVDSNLHCRHCPTLSQSPYGTV